MVKPIRNYGFEDSFQVNTGGNSNKHFEALLSKKELVVALGVSSSFVNKLMANESLPYFKIGRAVRFRISEISAWLNTRRHYGGNLR